MASAVLPAGLAVLATVLSMTAGIATAAEDGAPAVLWQAEKGSSPDPAAQGWEARHDKPQAAVARAAGTGDAPLWRIEDDDDQGGEGLYYTRELSAEVLNLAAEQGFRLEWDVRIPESTGGVTRAISTEVCLAGDGRKPFRFGVSLGRNGAELAASLYTGSRGVAEAGRAVKSPEGLHRWTLLFDPATELVNLQLDGQPLLAAKFDHIDRGLPLVFGSRSTGTGVSEWKQLAFQAGLAEGTKLVEPAAPPHQVDVFTGGEDDYFAYRIPSLITAPDGSLLAICEGRKSSLDDLGNNDLVLKRSTDRGRTWGPMQIIYDEGDKVTIGNPTPVIDRSTGTIWLVFGRNVTDALVMSSTDNGQTWSKPRNITPDIKHPKWEFLGIGPGIGIQLTHGPHRGRMLIPAYHRFSFNKRDPSTSCVFYSDDHGKTWQRGGDAAEMMNECQIVETSRNGKPVVLLNARNHWARSGGRPDLNGVRMVSVSTDGGETFGEPVFDKTLIEPTCQASVLRIDQAAAAEGNAASLPSPVLLFANPASTGR
ncbi:MAG: exo-alpha-sialidase, partial [Planctomycetaceae bacterium]|nr:exo-alpha-sialidase [Planctomycetaceae bacterium]